MRFMTMVKGKEDQGPPPPALMEAMGKLVEEAIKGGSMVEMGGLAPSAMGVRVRLSGGKVSVIDGPYAEAKEVVGGFAILELESREEAIEVAKNFIELHCKHWPGWEGESEVRQIFS